MTNGKNLWFRVIGSGLSGSARRSADEAWASVYRHGRIDYGYAECHHGTADAAHSLRLVCGTTRRAVEDADVSRTSGDVGRGEWWSAGARPDMEDDARAAPQPTLRPKKYLYRVVRFGFAGPLRQTEDAAWDAAYDADIPGGGANARVERVDQSDCEYRFDPRFGYGYYCRAGAVSN